MNIRFSGQYSMARVTAKQFNYINSHKGMQSNLLQGGCEFPYKSRVMAT